jgi:ferredoxin
VVHIAGSGKSFLWSPEAGTLLDAAHAAGISLASGCRVGQCESCAMRIVEGEAAHLNGSSDTPGQCLTCQAVPLSELTLAS